MRIHPILPLVALLGAAGCSKADLQEPEGATPAAQQQELEVGEGEDEFLEDMEDPCKVLVLNDLDRRVVQDFRGQPEVVANVVARYQGPFFWHWKTPALLWREVGDKQKFDRVVSDAFDGRERYSDRSHEQMRCLGFDTNDLLRRRAELSLERDHLWNAYLDFKEIGHEDGILRVIDAYEGKAELQEWETRELDRLYAETGQLDKAEGYLKEQFFNSASVDSAVEKMRGHWDVEPKKEWYVEFGDQLFERATRWSDVREDYLEEAVEAYKRGGNKDAVRKVLDLVLSKNSGWPTLDAAFAAASYLGDEKNSAQIATRQFVENPFDNPEQHLTKAGITPSADLYNRRGEHMLGRSDFSPRHFASAYEAFTMAGNEDGVNRVIAAYTAPPKTFP